MTFARLTAATILMAASPVFADMPCAEIGPFQYADGMAVCVSDFLLDRSGRYYYGPENLIDGDPATAWCEGQPGNGIGSRIHLVVFNGAPFDRLYWENGYAKSDRTYTTNARPRLVEISTDTGLSFQTSLPDTAIGVDIRFPYPAAHGAVTITVLDVYPGTKYQDMCLNGVTPDFEATNLLGN